MTPRFTNRLAQESSPYLLQHQHNPVDWFPWGAEAFEKARAENKPIFLSVGYSSCHWCHVMEHESFEDAQVAEVLNRAFISVKVDREERPDIDEAYMTAVQLSSGRGGWPMSLFLTPEKDPFFAGTYFPKNDRGGQAGFLSMCLGIEQYWERDRAEIIKSATEFKRALETALTKPAPASDNPMDAKFLENAIEEVLSDYDPQNGGFGGRPKFPPYTALMLLLDYARWNRADEDLARRCLHAAGHTLEAMCLGGIYDHVGGGFHRYSTDERWHLPHFEKMLYDNALLLAPLSIAAELIPSVAPLYTRAIQGTVGWLKREMRTGDGLFGSALDADSAEIEGGHKEEGKYYVWTQSQLDELLGESAKGFCADYQCEPSGNFHDEATGKKTGENLLNLRPSAERLWEADLNVLLQARQNRPMPGFDHKALVGWNALLADGLLAAGDVDTAEQIVNLLLDATDKHGSVPHMVVNGEPVGHAFLEDIAALLIAVLSLYAIRPTERLSVSANILAKTLTEEYFDEARSVFLSTSTKHETLFGRTNPVFDQPIPSGNAIAIRALTLNGETARAAKVLDAQRGWMERVPGATEGMLRSVIRILDFGTREDKAEVQFSVEASETEAAIRASIPPALHLRGISVEANQPIVVSQDPEPEDGYTLTHEIAVTWTDAKPTLLKITYQPCTDWECLLPVTKPLEI